MKLSKFQSPQLSTGITDKQIDGQPQALVPSKAKHILTASACQHLVRQLWELQHQRTHPTEEKFSTCFLYEPMCYRGQMGSTAATRQEARTSRFCHGMTTLGARECCCNDFSSSPCAAVGVKSNQLYGEGVAWCYNSCGLTNASARTREAVETGPPQKQEPQLQKHRKG